MKSRKTSKPERLFLKAVEAVENRQATRREAAIIARLPLSTFQYRLQKKSQPQARLKFLSAAEENTVVELIARYAHRRFNLRRNDVALAIQDLVTSMPLERQRRLPFKDGKPGQKYLKAFAQRHASRIKFGRASLQEQARWRATNADNLTKHFARLEAIIQEHNIDAPRIANLDETGTTPDDDCTKSPRTKSYCLRGSYAQQQAPKFSNVKRITMMRFVFADSHVGRPLFAIRGTQLKFRFVIKNGIRVMETVADCLPRDSLITTRQEVASVDSHNFYNWAAVFAEDMKGLTDNGRKVLLILDGYRCHMAYPILKLLETHGIIVYALPAHTSGSTQPLDVSVFGPFKEHLRNCIEELATPFSTNVYDVFDYLKVMREAYGLAFTRKNVLSGFEKSGIWPLNYKALLNTPRPASTINTYKILSVCQLEELMEGRRARRREIMGIQPVVTKSGFVDTTSGLLLTSPQAMVLANQKHKNDTLRLAAKERKLAESARKEAETSDRVRVERLRHDAKALAFRIKRYGVCDRAPKPLAVRRQIAKERTAAMKERSAKLANMQRTRDSISDS